MTVRLRFEIDAGWADCHIAVDGHEATVTASYLSDGIGDLAASVASLLRGAPDSTIVFAEEPGEYRWTLERRDPDRVGIHVLATPGLAANPGQGEIIVLDAECRLRTFAGQFASELRRLHDEFGAEG